LAPQQVEQNRYPHFVVYAVDQASPISKRTAKQLDRIALFEWQCGR
jgi:hypothetical protein